MTDPTTVSAPPRVAYIGCWYKNDMYSHNCSNLVDSLRAGGLKIDVVTSNCRCFSSAQRFDVSTDELINGNCAAMKIPHAPQNPGKSHGLLKYLIVKGFRLDIWLALARGVYYYRNSRQADVIHYDQVLEAFGSIPLFVLAMLAGLTHKRLMVTIHEIEPFQRAHRWMNRMYGKCEEVLVYSEDMKRAVVALGVAAEKIRVIRYGLVMPTLTQVRRTRYLYFGGHFILKDKGYPEFLGALKLLKTRGIAVQLLIYVGHGCNGLEEARAMADRAGVNDMIQWGEFFSGAELAAAYQASKACIVPYTGGSARHPLSSAMANGTPVIATRAADIPEYLGPLGIYIDGSAESIAKAICEIEDGTTDVAGLSRQMRNAAMAELDVVKIAADLSPIYSSKAS